ncbi:metal ABC transporter substrate-binding protein [Cellulomonas shaoxiangyii]|uniref:Zinc ABC transporter substrate-binding protein n=1 Tax=Cellulomonas shaoxiangyii TaxID=2566013 RepID=A0A4P7SL35_9CELL|nr:metal ABC transporter substrate-binding protein [Cellulomonas shaoxiangyii]QCB93263.1 zinc ABC transporter substrate-binding protein [Cellulomonas shaoxiangyii]TGY83717.1 zinc ABC transporter substrate-binding protein [Cellulomonas shaoxiangyii]
MSRPSRALALLAAPALLVAGCSSGGDASDDTGRVAALASFYPLQYVTQEVGGDRVDVASLTPPSVEPHDVELSPAQVADVSSADLVVYQSGFQPAVDEAVEQAQPGHVVDATAAAGLDEGGTHADEPGEHTADDGHEHDGLDPHFWLDPTMLAPVADAVADALTEVDPDGADTYRANADALTARLAALDEAYRTGLATCERDVVVTSHEAFGHLARRYGLEQVGISGIDPEAEPSPARLREVADVVRDEGVTTIFFETLVSPKVAETLAADLGVRTAVLDPLEGLADDAQDYVSVAEQNLEALRVALSCS